MHLRIWNLKSHRDGKKKGKKKKKEKQMRMRILDDDDGQTSDKSD